MEEIFDTTDDAVKGDEDAKSDAIEEAVAAESDTKNDSVAAAVDYEALIESDMDKLRAEFPELRGITDITELNNPLRYAALRDLGLTPEEAYLATSKRRTQDTRAHLKSAHGRSASAPMGIMSQRDLATARDLFPDLSDAELQRLYKRVSR